MKIICLIFFALTTLSCTVGEKEELKRGQRAADSRQLSLAIDHFEKTLKRSPDSDSALSAARQGFRLSYYELKDYRKAINFLRFLILKSPESKDRIALQTQMAKIYFDHLQDYDKSIEEFGKLTTVPLNEAETMKVKFYLAQAYYHKNDFFQAKSEIKELLQKSMTSDLRFNVLILQTNIFVSERRWSEAIDNYQKLIQLFPEKDLDENLSLNLSACFEENQDYGNAVAVLEKLKEKHADQDYINLRIKKIQQRSKNQPGAKGFRK
jgi:tetratricopeptide (TPR) repeat protein